MSNTSGDPPKRPLGLTDRWAMRAVGALCVGAVTLPLTARVGLAIWEMDLVVVLVGLGLFFLRAKVS